MKTLGNAGDAGKPSTTPITRRTMDMRGIEGKVSLKETAIRQRIAEDPDFPKPFRVGGKLMFFEDEVDAWLERLAAHRVTLRPYVRRSHGAAQPEAR